jgi:hypothetical protein
MISNYELNVEVSHSDAEIRVGCEELDFALAFTAYGPPFPHPAAVDFAAWAFLPIAMRLNRPLLVRGVGSETTAANAERLSQVWATWLPDRFSPVDVTFEEYRDHPPQGQQRDLVLYSGGVDSTYNLLRRAELGSTQSLLTIHGLDYKFDDEQRFWALVEKTRPFADSVGDERFFLRTNAYSVYREFGLRADVTHGFLLATCLFLYATRFAAGVISADHRLDQQFRIGPWGTNAITNEYFDSGSFKMQTADQDVTRAEKMPVISRSKLALNALSFCVDYAARPHNCGKCQKCIRTKTMFLASTGSVPDICTDNSVTPSSLDAIDMTKPNQAAFFYDLYWTAHRNGNADKIPNLEEKFQQSVREPKVSLATLIRVCVRQPKHLFGIRPRGSVHVGG